MADHVGEWYVDIYRSYTPGEFKASGLRVVHDGSHIRIKKLFYGQTIKQRGTVLSQDPYYFYDLLKHNGMCPNRFIYPFGFALYGGYTAV